MRLRRSLCHLPFGSEKYQGRARPLAGDPPGFELQSSDAITVLRVRSTQFLTQAFIDMRTSRLLQLHSDPSVPWATAGNLGRAEGGPRPTNAWPNGDWTCAHM